MAFSTIGRAEIEFLYVIVNFIECKTAMKIFFKILLVITFVCGMHNLSFAMTAKDYIGDKNEIKRIEKTILDRDLSESIDRSKIAIDSVDKATNEKDKIRRLTRAWVYTFITYTRAKTLVDLQPSNSYAHDELEETIKLMDRILSKLDLDNDREVKEIMYGTMKILFAKE